VQPGPSLLQTVLVLKISVLASGVVLVDGQAVDIAQLDKILQTAKENNRSVHYYREAAGSEALPQSMEVMKLIVKHKLPISMSTKPDFSDVVDTKAVFEKVFEEVRKLATRGLVIVKPNLKHLMLPAMAKSPQLESLAASMEKLIPPEVKRKVAVISNSSFEADTPDIKEVAKSIPFLGVLMGLTYIGHGVWVFGGTASTLTPGCRDADVLIVDSAKLPVLPSGWQDAAAAVMRNANILLHNRENFQLGIVRKAGTGTNQLEFPN
jgi:hypothetical protein